MEDNKGISILYKICIVIMVLLLAPMFLIGLVGFGIYWLLKKFFWKIFGKLKRSQYICIDNLFFEIISRQQED